jgi:4-hydroxy-tetrahydrodipicolinate reductase
MPSPLRVAVFGLGAIGGAVARALLQMDGVDVVCAIDSSPKKAGRNLHPAVRLRGQSRVTVSDNAAGALRDSGAHVVIHCTGSHLAEIAPQLRTIIDAGIPCVSSSEEMAYPAMTDPGLAASLDAHARQRGVAVIGAGINPGFIMDSLALALSGASRRISHISIERVLDPLSRRKAFQRKVGIGLGWRQACRQLELGRLGHVGLKHSAMLVARGLGWDACDLVEDVSILCAGDVPLDEARRSRRAPDPGAEVIGMHQVLTGTVEGREVLRLEMLMAAGVEAPHDAIKIQGDPDVNLWVQGGVPGDSATVACLLNAIPQAVAPPRPGLLTMLDLPLRRSWGPPA